MVRSLEELTAMKTTESQSPAERDMLQQQCHDSVLELL